MKKQFLSIVLILLTTFCFSQSQIGNILRGEEKADAFGGAIDISEDGLVLAVGIHHHERQTVTRIPEKPGKVKVFYLQNGQWVQRGETLQRAEIDEDNFGVTLALSDKGNRIAIGRPGRSEISDSSYVVIYEWISNQWRQMGDIVRVDSLGRSFASGVSCSGDCKTIAVSASGFQEGRINVFRWNGNNWENKGKILAGTTNGEGFGQSFALNKSGNRLVTWSTNISTGNFQPTLRVFDYIGDDWQLTNEITDFGMIIPNRSGLFGALKLAQDGNRITLGAPRANVARLGYGEVRIFDVLTDTIVQVGKTLEGSDRSELYGSSVAISQDGTKIAIGAHKADSNFGKVEIFSIQSGEWYRSGQVLRGDGISYNFGAPISISENGERLAVTADAVVFDRRVPAERIGQVQVFDLLDTTPYYNLTHFQVFTGDKEEQSFQKLNSYSSRISDTTNEFLISADGSKSSQFILESLGKDTTSNWYVELSNCSNEEDCGSLKVLKQNRDSLILEFRHPIYINPSDTRAKLSFVLYEDITKNDTIDTFDLVLFRPPVLFVHGLWGNPNNFESLKSRLEEEGKYESFQLMACDYTERNSFHFAENRNVIKEHIKRTSFKLGLIDRYITKKIAAAKVDIVAHSMGGILSRLYIQDESQYNKINRLITVNTPHAGSQMANLILDDEYSFRTGFLRTILGSIGLNCNEGAVDDLAVDSEAILKLNSASELPVPSHTISSLVPFSPSKILELSLALETISRILELDDEDIQQIFNGQNSDGIVSVASQTANFIGNKTTIIEDPDHVQILEAPQLIDRVCFLLNQKSTSSYFSLDGFQPINETYNTPNNLEHSLDGKLTVIKPSNSDEFFVDEEIELEFEGNSEISRVVMRLNNGDNRSDVNARFEIAGNNGVINFEIKKAPRLGQRFIILFGYNENGEVVDAVVREIFINTREIPRRLSFAPFDSVVLKEGQIDSFSIRGHFDDFTSSLNRLSTLRVNIKDRQIAEYLGENQIKGLKEGQTEMIVTFNGVKSDPIPIFVQSPEVSTSFQDNKVRKSNLLKVFPNPTQNHINIEFNTKNNFLAKVFISDINGKYQKSFDMRMQRGKNLNKINISGLPGGTYLISVFDTSQSIVLQSTKFIKESN